MMFRETMHVYSEKQKDAMKIFSGLNSELNFNMQYTYS